MKRLLGFLSLLVVMLASLSALAQSGPPTPDADSAALGTFLTSLLLTQKWTVVAAMVVYALIRIAKSDKIPFSIPARLRPWVSIALGIVYGGLQSVIRGTGWGEAFLAAAITGLGPVMGHEFVVESLRNGKELFPPKANVGAAVLLLAGASLLGTSGCGLSATKIADAGKVITDIIRVVQEAQSGLEELDHKAQPLVALLPQAEQEAYAKAMGNGYQALRALDDVASGTKSLTQDQVDEAFKKYAAAYNEITGLLERDGVMNAGRFRTKPGGGYEVEPIKPPAAALPHPVRVES